MEVTDTAGASPRLRTAGEGVGYGLALVDALADRWGTTRDGDSNPTWLELDLPAPGAYAGSLDTKEQHADDREPHHRDQPGGRARQ